MIEKYINLFFSFIKKYISPERGVLLVFLAFVINIFWAYFSIPSVNPGLTISKLYLLVGDANGYVNMSESFYSNFCWGNNNVPSDYRLPGYLFIYLPFRLFLNQNNTLNAIIVAQFILSAISKYYLAKLAFKLFNSYSVFILTFLLYNISDVASGYNLSLYTESYANSILILLAYTLYLFIQSKSKNQLLLLGFLFIIVFMLRPFMGILLVFILFILLSIYKSHFKKLVITACIFCTPFILFEVVWITRNYIQFNKFQPLETSVNQGRTSADNPYSLRLTLVKNTGASEISWSPNTAGTWFTEDEFLVKNGIPRPNDDILPKELFTENLTIDKLKLARSYDWKSQDTLLSEDSTKWYSLAAVSIYKEYISSFKQNHPYQYYIGSRLKHFYYHIYQPDSPFKSARYPVNALLVFNSAVVNTFIFFFGFICLIVLLFKWHNIYRIILCGIPFFLFTLFPFILKSSEPRSVLLAFPFICIASAWGINMLLMNKNRTIGLGILIVSVGLCIFVGYNYTVSTIKF